MVEGISFQHFVANVMTGKPLGGNALNILKNSGKSFVMGHKQVLDIAIKPVLGGGHQLGVVVGACYEHDEGYKGYQGNNHFRGCVMLYEVEDGFALPKPVSLNHMRKVDEPMAESPCSIYLHSFVYCRLTKKSRMVIT